MTMEQAREKALADEQSGALENKPAARKTPNKFTPQTIEDVLRAFANGNPLADAAAIARINVSTLTQWLRIGANDFEQGFETDYAKFYLDAQQARSLPVVRATKVVNDAVNRGDVQTAKWLLERRRPEEFNPAHRVELGGSADAPLVIELKWPTSGISDGESLAIDAPSEEIVDAEIVDGDSSQGS